jgi:hypothetical protein
MIFIFQNEPNPANESTTIHFNLISKNSQLHITDMLGNIVFEKEVNGTQFTIDLKNFRPGIYYYELISDNRKLLRKMAVVK